MPERYSQFLTTSPRIVVTIYYDRDFRRLEFQLDGMTLSYAEARDAGWIIAGNQEVSDTIG